MKDGVHALMVLAVVAGSAHARPYDRHPYLEPYLDAEITIAKDGTTPVIAATMSGYPMPSADRIRLYASGDAEYRVRPRSLKTYAEGPEPLALAIVFPEREAWVGAALRHADLASKVPRGSRVTVYSYGDDVDQRLPWSPIGALRDDVFGGRGTTRGAALLVRAVDEAVIALSEVNAPRRMLLVIADGCVLSEEVLANRDELEKHLTRDIESVEILLEGQYCVPDMLEGFVQTQLSASTAGFDNAIAEVIRSRFTNRWYATFDASWLRRSDDGVAELALDVGARLTPRRMVYFGDDHYVSPAPLRLPSLRQLALGALLVGLLALLVRSTIGRKSRESVT